MRKMWSPVISSSDILDNNGPKKRCKHAVCRHMENIYMYGGKQGHRALKDLWKYDLIDKTWDKIESQGESPPALQQHTMVTNGEKLYVFGGELCVSTETPLWIYDIQQNFWNKYNSKSQRHSVKYAVNKNKNSKMNNEENPSGRRGHTTVLIHPRCDTLNVDNEGSKMIVYGGFKEPHGSTEELYSFDIAQETWHQLNPKEQVPSARHNHSAVVYNGYMWIYGGMTNLKERNDFWKYNISSNQWESINSGQGPGYLHSHSAVVLNDNMIIFGGETQGALSNDIWKFSFQNELWEKISCDIKPSPCTQLAAIAVSSYQIEEKTVSNPVYGKDMKFRNSVRSHGGYSCDSRQDNEYKYDSVSEYNQEKSIVSMPCDIPQLVEPFSKKSSPSSSNGSFKNFEFIKKSYISDDERILVNEMENSSIDDSLCDTIDGKFEYSDSDLCSGDNKDKVYIRNENLEDMTLSKQIKNDYCNLINDYSDDNEYLYNWHELSRNSYNEKHNAGFICEENSFEMQDFSINDISNTSYKEGIQSIDLDTNFERKTITYNNQSYEYKDYNKSSMRDLMYIFCGKEGSQTSQITGSLTIWEFDLHLKAN